MAFGARQEDGKWRLCLRKGRTITKMSFTDGSPPQEIQFKSQVKAKACADALNETYWKEYDRWYSKGQPFPSAQAMVNLISEHII
ncbi:hypothetical protein NKJ88_06205 [Mesorhizobium sp. M0016]|uniref:hypothetical protein n=1 Tax=Mesorhizobium sp. M0016 TaxID=2956843 RepID=UPI00333ACEE7